MGTTTIEQILADVRSAAKAGKWLSCTYRINTDKGVFSLGVKAFGKWVQRIECCELRADVSEQKTWKAFDAEFRNVVNALVRAL